MAHADLSIAFDGRVLVNGELRGFSRYTAELVQAIHESRGGAVRMTAFSPQPLHPIFRALPLEEVVFPAAREFLWEQWELPRRLRAHGIDVFHATGNRGLPLRAPLGRVVTIHDIVETMPELAPSGSWRSSLRRRYADFCSVRGAHHIIAVSEHAKRDICRHWRLPGSGVTVTHEAAAPRFYARVVRAERADACRRYGLPQAYFLYVGGFDRKKNIAELVAAHALLPPDAPHLVLAGERKWGFAELQHTIAELGLGDRVLTPGMVHDDDLPALYQSALAFIYPSLYEGFGLQLVEAMASGIPVLASGNSCFPEILDGAGLLFDPRDRTDIARCMREVAGDPELRARLGERSRARASCFSWHETARRTLAVYDEVRRAVRP